MKEKDIAYIKIIQFIKNNKNVKIGGHGGVYEHFNMVSDKNGNYINKGEWPFSARSLLRYLNELCDIGIIKSRDEGKDRIFSINNDKYSFDFNVDKAEFKNILRILLENKEVDLYNKIKSFSAVTEILTEIGSDKKVDRLLSKINLPENKIDLNENIEEKIKTAICEDSVIEITYKQKMYRIIPLAIVKSFDKNKKYLFYLRRNKIEQPFDMFNIKEVEIKEKTTIKNKEKYLESIKNRWDIDGGFKIDVQVQFPNNRNVIEIVKRDLKCRDNYKLYKKDNQYIYEDTVEGINDFKRWIRKYSNNCIVIKPESLREEILASNLKKLERYEGV